MSTNNKNSNLTLAKKNKNDEFYTQFEDINNELKHYKEHFRGKVVLCNCDDPKWSNFWNYFILNFEHLGLKKLISTHYEESGSSYKLECVGLKNENGELITLTTALQGNGDFRSYECIELLKEANIVVTNPPFSLFREYVAQLVEFAKQFIIIGNLNAITYKDIFKLLKSNELWFGSTYFNGGAAYFNAPIELYDKDKMSNEKNAYFKEGQFYWRVNGVRWFTNINHKKRNEELILYRKHNEVDYPKYDNYDAIEVSKVKDIPINYDGVMGVPISFMDKFNPNQFEILDINPHFFIIVDSGLPKPKQLKLIGKKDPYARILIKRIKQPGE